MSASERFTPFLAPALGGRHVLDVLTERGFVQQTTDRAALREALATPGLTFYVGFDPTAPSLHVGHLLPMMAMRWLSAAGHRPVVVHGGGTARVGDPSGKDRTRDMLDDEGLARNLDGQRPQFDRFFGALTVIDAHAWSALPDGGHGPEATTLMVNNASWLMGWGYIDFLREVGRHFSVNRMLSAESSRLRLERDQGLSFIEFNYHLLQSYDFLALWRKLGCTLQVGGDDQWFNILGGVDLIRREGGPAVHALTTPLLATSDGKKMGKTEKGAVFLDPAVVGPFDYFQFWINCTDADVGRLLRIYTFLPIDEIIALEALRGADLREAKRVLAFQATVLAHGEAAAREALSAAELVFAGGAAEAMPTAAVDFPIAVVDALVAAGFAKSKGEARRLIAGGGVRLGDDRVDDPEARIDAPVVMWKGKKQAARLMNREA
jgi:tyrosyl-tRNA synthetase